MEIFENNVSHLADFIRLNEDWISRYFEIEDVDRALAANPQKVIDEGGYIYSLQVEKNTVGVCALFNEKNGAFELARMAVSPEHHGKGYGDALMRTCFKKLDDIKATKVYLVSNTKLSAAISLYKKYGFVVTFEGKHPVYSRANICMEYCFNNG
ncbi:MAG: GNAT family N-acetyltransferase [Gammaproteobacteria bacterium]|nr:GNAT family N-acetyltransferase [Gammaproteobacteria bacterium]